MAQYRELAVFTQFGSDVDATTQAQLSQGERLTETLKQGRYNPYTESQEVCLLLAMGCDLTAIPMKKMQQYNRELLDYLENYHGRCMRRIENII